MAPKTGSSVFKETVSSSTTTFRLFVLLGLILDTYCVLYPHVMLFFEFCWTILQSKTFKFACRLREGGIIFALPYIYSKTPFFHSYCTHALPFQDFLSFFLLLKFYIVFLSQLCNYLQGPAEEDCLIIRPFSASFYIYNTMYL